MLFKPQQSKTQITGAEDFPRRPLRRRRLRLAQAIRRQAPPKALRQDSRPFRERHPLSHRKAHPMPSSGWARWLFLGEPPTLPRSRGRRSGTALRGASRHVSLRKVQGKEDQTLRSSSQETPRSYRSRESCAAAAACLPWPHIQARMVGCASASTCQGSTKPRLRSTSSLHAWGVVRVTSQLRSHATRPAECGRCSSAPAEEHSGGSGGQALHGPGGDGDGPRRSTCAPEPPEAPGPRSS